MSRRRNPREERERLVHDLVRSGYIRSDAVRDAFRRVPREAFVSPRDRDRAYVDTPLPIPYGQTISAPSMVAIMLEEAALKESERVLELGAGSGYHAALIACLVGAENVVTVERIPELAEWGRANLAAAGFPAVRVVTGDGSLGFPDGAPYACILATAGAPRLPAAWARQLGPHGRIVAPIGSSRNEQVLAVATRQPDGSLDVRYATACAFVPLIGEDAWPSG